MSDDEHAHVLRACGWTVREFEAGHKRSAAPEHAKLVGSGPSKGGVLENVLRRPSAADVMPETPLTLWDPRKQQVAAVQERLNAFYGTKALEVDGEFGPLTQQVVDHRCDSRRNSRRNRRCNSR